jgi:hypothetical protein
MNVIDIDGANSQIKFSRDELRILNAALNEICNGISIREFETRIGASRQEVANLLNEIHKTINEMKLIAPNHRNS